MTNPTSNFGWQMPTNTDLVTDLPADFEVFGQAVDTTLADLKGGTSGQVLAKASATDMDFTWTTPEIGDITAITVTAPITGGGTTGSVGIAISDASTSAKGAVQLSDSTSTTSSVLASTPTATKTAYDLAAAAIPKSTVTTAGDVIYATGSGAVTRLGIGTAGQVLTVNSGATAPEWATASSGSASVAGKNAAINGAFQIWQRGTSIAFGAGTYTADRWQGYNSSVVGTASRQATNDTTNLPNIQYCARVQRTASSSATTTIQYAQTLESINSIPYAGKTITFSFYARKGANYSATSSLLNTLVVSGTGTDQNVLTGFTGSSSFINQNATLTTTWQRFSYTATVATSATQLGFLFNFSPTGTAGAADYFEVTGVQLEMASSATQFSTATNSIGSELALCQRYYYQSDSQIWTNLQYQANVNVSRGGTLFLPQFMRVAPTLTLFDSPGNSGKISVSASSGGYSDNISPNMFGLGSNTYAYYAVGSYVLGYTSKITASAEL